MAAMQESSKRHASNECEGKEEKATEDEKERFTRRHGVSFQRIVNVIIRQRQ